MRILVTGGAGYIGSQTCKQLAKKNYFPIVYDNLGNGHEWAVKWGPLYRGNILDFESLVSTIKKEKPEAIFHFAALASVEESARDPLKYYENNVLGTLSILRAMLQTRIKKIIFSSSCSIYGVPDKTPIHEETSQNPINTYGQTKLQCEHLIKDFCLAYDIQAVALRYFNAAGADLENEIGEMHEPETHLIPLAIRAAFEHSKPLTIMGSDYSTLDGTCVRDFVHVEDLAEAHILALEFLQKKQKNFSSFNLGTGQGISVREVISFIEKKTQKKVATETGLRRPGDPPTLVADGKKAIEILGWSPQHSSADIILSTAINWHKKMIGQRSN